MADTFRALVLEETDGKVSASVQTVEDSALPDGDVTVAVEYSDLNYKDGMVVKGIGRLVRAYPHVPGIDFAGTVEASAHADYAPGDKVVLTGWRVGEVWCGCYDARVVPSGVDPYDVLVRTLGAVMDAYLRLVVLLRIFDFKVRGLPPTAGPGNGLRS